MNSAPRARLCGRAGASARMNCGRNAAKKSAVLGLKRATMTASRNTRRTSGAWASDAVDADDVRDAAACASADTTADATGAVLRIVCTPI